MSYKWMLLTLIPMAAVPSYLLWQGDGLGAAIIAIPLFLVCAAVLGFIRRLSAE